MNQYSVTKFIQRNDDNADYDKRQLVKYIADLKSASPQKKIMRKDFGDRTEIIECGESDLKEVEGMGFIQA